MSNFMSTVLKNPRHRLTVSTLQGVSKNRPSPLFHCLNNREKTTDFDNFWCTTSGRNLKVMYWPSSSINCCQITFCTLEQFVGEVGTFVFSKCQVYSGYCVPKLLQSLAFHRVIPKIKERRLSRHIVYDVTMTSHTFNSCTPCFRNAAPLP